MHEDAVDLTLVRWQDALSLSPVLQCLVKEQEPVTAETLQVEVARTPLYNAGKLLHRAHVAAGSTTGKKVRLAPRHYLPE